MTKKWKRNKTLKHLKNKHCKMFILITGGNGFIAREIKPFFEKAGFTVENPSRHELDVYNQASVNTFFEKYYDIVIHTAVKGGRRTIPDTPDMVLYNWTMFQNLVEQVDNNKIGKLIHIGSGAAFDRKRDILNFDHFNLRESIPRDFYGLSKFLIENYIFNTDKPIFNIRVFGCFGFSEQPDRFIHSAITNVINQKPIKVFNDRYMDFIYVEDLATIILDVITDPKEKDINACYPQKYLLSEVAQKVKSLLNSNVDIEVGEFVNNYCGKSNIKIDNLKGLDLGILNFYEFLVKENIL